MAKGKRSKNNNYVSKGQRLNVRKDICKAQRRDYLANKLDVVANKIAAWKTGKAVFLTIPNPNKNETNKRFIRVPATQIWGNPNNAFKMPTSG